MMNIIKESKYLCKSGWKSLNDKLNLRHDCSYFKKLCLRGQIERAHEIKITVKVSRLDYGWISDLYTFWQSFVTFLALLIWVSFKTIGFWEGCMVVYDSNRVQATWLEKSMKGVLFLADALGGISYDQVVLSRERHLSQSSTLTA